MQAVQDEDAIGERRVPEARQLHGTTLLARLAVGPCADIRLLDLDRRIYVRSCLLEAAWHSHSARIWYAYAQYTNSKSICLKKEEHMHMHARMSCACT